MSDLNQFFSSMLGALIGGALGVIGTTFSAYFGPRKLEEWKQRKAEELQWGPRKKLLKQLLDDPKFKDGRSLERLRIVTGTTSEECRRLLIEIGARGVILQGDLEGWALISRRPLDDE